MKNGLMLERKAGTNPYKFGMIGSTYSRSVILTAEEENDVATEPPCEPSADRTTHVFTKSGNKEDRIGAGHELRHP